MDIDLHKLREKAFDHLFDAIVVTDAQGTIIDWNKGSEALYGYSKEEAIGQAVSILHVPEDIEVITAKVMEAVAKDGKWSGEVRMLHKNGHIGWIESMCVPILDEQQQMIGALGVNRDITKRVNETVRLEHLAHYDQLTKIPNRYLLLDRLSHLITQSHRHDLHFALFFIDVDKFKAINDNHGHLIGDNVLIEVASRLKRAIRDSDTVARFGGDEFVILFENISDNSNVSVMVETLKTCLNSKFIINNEEIDVTCSIGIATFPEQGITTDALLSVADKAMYLAKKHHR